MVSLRTLPNEVRGAFQARDIVLPRGAFRSRAIVGAHIAKKAAWRAKVQGQATRPHSQLSEYGFFSGVLGVEPRSEIGLSHIATQRS